MRLEKWALHVWRCFGCLICRDTISYERGVYKVCPVYDQMKFDHYCAGGRMKIAKALLEGSLKYSKGLVDNIYTCVGCGSCTEVCAVNPDNPGKGLDINLIIRAMREDIVNAGLGPPEPLKKRDLRVQKEGNPFGKPAHERSTWAEDLKLSEKGEFLYFPGCYASFENPVMARATTKILKAAGLDIAYLGAKERCCGHILFEDGQRFLAEEHVYHNAGAFTDANVTKAIFSCAGCYDTFKNHYPSVVGKLPFETFHSTQILAELVDVEKIKFHKNVEAKVTYHDPCHLGRHNAVYEEPRKVLQNIPGLKLIEMKRDDLPSNRSKAWCCGGGGGVVPVAFPNLSLKIALTRLDDAIATGADTLITTCPMCLTNLSIAAKVRGVNMKFCDLNVFVAKAMGITI